MIAAMELWLATCHDIKTTFNATNKIQNKIIITLNPRSPLPPM